MVDHVLRPILQTLLAVLLVVSLTITVLLCGLQTVVYCESLYHDIPDDPAFVEGMTAYVLDDLDAECLFYDLPFDVLKSVITEERVHTWSREYTVAVYDALCNGGDVKSVTVDPAPYRAVLDAFFESLPESERPLDANAAQTIAGELAQSTAGVLSSGLINVALDYGHRFVYGDTPLRRAASQAGIGIAVTVLLTVLSLLPWGGWRHRFYVTAGSLFVGSALAFVPLWLLQRHGIPDRLAIGRSPLKLYVDGVLDGIINGMTTLALWVLISSTVLLIASVAVYVKGLQSKKET